MKLVDVNFRNLDENPNILCVGLAVDSDVYYAALVDTTTYLCYVEEVGLTPAKTGFNGIYRKIENGEVWNYVYNFFVKAGAFDKYLKGKNWRWVEKNGKAQIPKWFTEKVQK